MPTALIAGIDISAWRKPAIELAVPLHVAAEPDRHARGDHLERPAERVARLLGGVDAGDHLLRDRQDRRSGPGSHREEPPRARTGRCVSGGRPAVPIVNTWLVSPMPACARSCRATAPAATRAAVSRALARSRMSRTSDAAVLCHPGEIGMAGPGPGHRCAPRAACIGWRLLGDPHRVLPVRPVAILDHHRDRAADGLTGPNARENLRGIRLDRHPPAAPVAALPAAQLARDRIEVEGEPCRDAFEDDDERAAVRLASGQKSHHSREIVYEVSASPGRLHAPHPRGNPCEFDPAMALHCDGAMSELIADRFISSGGRQLDLASGAPVQLHARGRRHEQRSRPSGPTAARRWPGFDIRCSTRWSTTARPIATASSRPMRSRRRSRAPASPQRG